MRKRAMLSCAVLALFSLSPVGAMNNYDDPRVVLSYRDGSLDGARDILRVATSVRDDTHLVFEVKTRSGEMEPLAQDYLLLQISQQSTRHLLVPIDPAVGNSVVDYEADSPPGPTGLAGARLRPGPGAPAFRARRIPQGVEFLVPLSWIDYGEEIAFDAFSVRGRPSRGDFVIDAVYDRAAKGRGELRRVSAITLLNNLCATRK